MSKKNVIPVDLLLVEDNPGDIRLTQEVLQEEKIINKIYIAKDGIEATQFLHKENPFSNVPTPDIIMLDLNLPRKDGREVLVEIKNDPYLKHIPVIILTSSQAEKDVAMSYNLYANCYIVKPINLDRFMEIIRSLENFWVTIVKLPPKESKVNAHSVD